MKLALFGATGATGINVVIQALKDEEGHCIKAIVRNVDKLKKELENRGAGDLLQKDELVVVHEEDIFNVDNVTKHLEDVDAVVSTLGFPTSPKPVTGYSKFAKTAVEAMNKTQRCRRLVLMHSWYTEEKARGRAPFLLRWTLIPMISAVLDDMRRAEIYLTDVEQNPLVKDIVFSVVLPPHITNNPVTDKDFKVKEDDWDVPGASGRIPRADCARYILKILKENLHQNKIVAIAS